MDTFAARLRHARGRAELSQESLAHRVGITKANISKMELGLTENCAFKTLFGMADVLAVDARWLALGGNLTSQDEEALPRSDIRAKLARMPKQLREPILQVIESTAVAADQRYRSWAKEQQSE